MYGLLVGKIAVVTGAAQGIGKAVALLYAQNGADVALCDINMEKVADAADEIAGATGQKCLPFEVNVADQGSVRQCFEAITAAYGKIDVLCHCAGILIHSMLVDMTVEEWDKIFAVNARGTFLTNQAAAKIMIKNGGGKIVDFSSCSGKKPTMAEGGYCSTKSAVNGFIKVAALEWGVYGICVNAICPGATDTDMVRSTFITSPEIEREWIEKTALKKLGRPIDQARVALFLASELADHITGETIIVSAGEMMTQ
jgi:NAD(P)-dependent dehydrogenase (short-subunit alcohol dehydrogenase family)